MKDGLISVILPVYNGHRHLSEAIDSVLNQSYNDWELLIINDGSTDNSFEIASSYEDHRITVLDQSNLGVSAARNKGLSAMSGEFFCFLDADDAFTKESLESRISYFADPTIAFVDGGVDVYDHTLSKVLRKYRPGYKGNPRRELVRLSEKVFFGPSWMIRRKPSFHYQFSEETTHMEDAIFFYEIADQGDYDFTDQSVLSYRKGTETAMSNLHGLEKGYRYFYKTVVSSEKETKQDVRYLRKRIIRILFRSYMRKLHFFDAIRCLFEI